MTRELLNEILHLLRPLSTRVHNLAARAIVQLVQDGTKLQQMQIGVLDGEDIDDAERFQGYGFTSVPLAGAEAVVVFPNGDRGHPLVVGVDDRRYRPTGLEPGEVAVYHKDGALIKLTKDGDIEVTPKSGRAVKIGGGGASQAPAFNADLETLRSTIAAASTGNAIPGAVGAIPSFTGATKSKIE